LSLLSERSIPVLLALLSAALFGVATPASKMLLVGLTPFQLAGVLYLGAALAVAPAALRQGSLLAPLRADGRTRLRLLGAVLFGGVIGPVALLFGLRLAQATSVSLWLNLELAATAVLGALLFRDHLSYKGWLGVVAGLLASALLAWGPDTAGLAPGLLILVACLCWGLDNHLTALIDGITPSQSTLWKGAIAGTVNLTIGAVLAPVSVTVQALAIALAVGALSYGVSIVLYIRSAQSLGATRAQVLFASAPFFGVAISVVALDESLSIVHALAVPLFVAGVVFLMWESHVHEHAHDAMSHEHAHRHDDAHHTHVHSGIPASLRHTHPHDHAPTQHRHPHWPDLHHRHVHESETD
jgi:drug/metabolite transporter (DMT)-like permease